MSLLKTNATKGKSLINMNDWEALKISVVLLRPYGSNNGEATNYGQYSYAQNEALVNYLQFEPANNVTIPNSDKINVSGNTFFFTPEIIALQDLRFLIYTNVHAVTSSMSLVINDTPIFSELQNNRLTQVDVKAGDVIRTRMQVNTTYYSSSYIWRWELNTFPI